MPEMQSDAGMVCPVRINLTILNLLDFPGPPPGSNLLDVDDAQRDKITDLVRARIFDL